ncbi:transposase [Geosporobacter ferrireducens]|uniref:transposase n=1 Tax=Geosporobacter ferrireducens TaxID=1424294 RepID=UPI001A9A31D4|nr:transposase [Geosporobacter ferrireducens]
MDLPQRKLQRLKNYDYSQNGAYFVTICTQKQLQLFGKIENKILVLNNAGRMVLDKFAQIPEFYPNISVDKFVVMPNHLHAILMIQRIRTAQGPFPTMQLSDYIHRFKVLTTKLYIEGVRKDSYPPFDKKVWQKSYHDHIIRNEVEYRKIWEYIAINPLKWELDKYYSE